MTPEFPTGAERYRAFLAGVFDGVRETPALFDLPAVLPELELQSLWFAGAFGRDFVSTSGQRVRIVQFGHWNHGAGPDFTDAALDLDGERHVGDIELDPEPQDWERHGHGANDAFNRVILHLFAGESRAEFFTRTAEHRNVCQVALDLESLREAYPRHGWVPEAKPGRCSHPLREMDSARLESLLVSASQYRLEVKAHRLGLTSGVHGSEEAVYQGIAEALGYRPNKLPMRVLAQRFPVHELLTLEPAEREACLFGASGFISHEPFEGGDEATRAYLRGLWDAWWKRRDVTAPLPPLDWKLSGIRPVNHPHRRLGALTELVHRWRKFARLLPLKEIPALWPKKVHEFLSELEHGFWSRHYTLRSKPVATPLALIGKDRINDILGNVLFPLAVSKDREQWDAYTRLPGSVDNEKLRRAMLRLFHDRPGVEKLAKAYYRQQALLQIYEDFCLEDHSECADCPFPEQLSQW